MLELKEFLKIVGDFSRVYKGKPDGLRNLILCIYYLKYIISNNKKNSQSKVHGYTDSENLERMIFRPIDVLDKNISGIMNVMKADHEYHSYPTQFKSLMNELSQVVFPEELDYKTGFQSIYNSFISDARSQGEFYLPIELRNIFRKLVKDSNSIYDPRSGNGELLASLSKTGARLIGEETNSVAKAISELRFIFDEDVTLLNSDSLESKKDSEFSVDNVLLFPPLGLRKNKDIEYKGDLFESPTSDPYIIWAQKALKYLKPGGKAYFLLSDKLLYAKSNQSEDFRKSLMEQGNIEAIISMPVDILPYTRARTSIWVFSKSSKKQNCLFLDYRTKSKDIDRTKIIERSEIFNSLISIYEKWLLNLDVNFIESPFSHVVTLDEAKENDYNFSFGRYFTFQNIDALDLENMTSLDEILTFNREGVSNNTESIVTKVSIKHLSKNPDDFYLDTIPLEVLDRKTRIPITSGNVLLVANVGQFIKPTFVQKQTEDIVFGLNNVDAYKVDLGQVNLEYLIQELNKDYVAEQASRFHIGVSMARLRKDDFLSIKINLPSLEEQEKLVKNEKQIRFQNLIRENGFEQELNRLKEQQRLDLGSKKHTLSQYVNSVKSSCSNLITVLNNNGGVLDGEYVINPQTGVTVRKRLDLLNDGIDKIIDQVENLTNEMVFDPKSILDARKMLKDCHTNGITSTRANFTFSYDEPTFDENSPLISVSETQFLELYNNIVDNAIRHGQFEEGKIEIKFLLSNEKGKVILEIKNNGKPFPEGISEKGVFTTKGEKAGETGHTGIGGWKIKEIVDYFGAKMEIIDEPKEEYPVGFKFLFNLEIDEV